MARRLGGLRAERKTRRIQQLAVRECVFDMIASGYSYHVIAATLEISVATVRREFDRAIAERRLDAPERYTKVQVARLNKVLRVVDELVDKGDPKAVAPLIWLVAALDRYHGLAPARAAPETPPPLALPAPPLALTHAAPPIVGQLADAGQTADLVDDPAQNSHEHV